MSLQLEMTDEEFTEEMTHRVVKFGARSPESREALRFCKRHPNTKLLKIARFKIGEQERFDVENGLASPWVRVLHFLDEEVFDRLRLGSIGQVATVTGFVLAILFLSDRTRSWFGSPPVPAVVLSEQEIAIRMNESPSPVEEMLILELNKALDSPQFKAKLDSALRKLPSSASELPTSPQITAALQSALRAHTQWVVPLVTGSDDDFAARLLSDLKKNGVMIESPDKEASILMQIRTTLSTESANANTREAFAKWIESPTAQAALKSVMEAKPQAEKTPPASQPTGAK